MKSVPGRKNKKACVCSLPQNPSCPLSPGELSKEEKGRLGKPKPGYTRTYPRGHLMERFLMGLSTHFYDWCGLLMNAQVRRELVMDVLKHLKFASDMVEYRPFYTTLQSALNAHRMRIDTFTPNAHWVSKQIECGFTQTTCRDGYSMHFDGCTWHAPCPLTCATCTCKRYIPHAKRNETMAARWSAEATRALLSMWGEQNIQSQVDWVVRNKVIYEKVAENLHELGYDFTWKQCRTKVKNLTQSYRKVMLFDYYYFVSWPHWALLKCVGEVALLQYQILKVCTLDNTYVVVYVTYRCKRATKSAHILSSISWGDW